MARRRRPQGAVTLRPLAAGCRRGRHRAGWRPARPTALRGAVRDVRRGARRVVPHGPRRARSTAAPPIPALRARAAGGGKGEQEAKRVADAKAAAQAKAAREAEAAAQAQAAREAAEAAAEAAARAQSNEPVSFTASAANWASAPNFSFPDRAARRARSGDTLNVVLILRVNKQGGIDSVRVAQSSGNTLLDKEAQRQVRSGKFKPFTKNGAPVVGNVTLPISYAVP